MTQANTEHKTATLSIEGPMVKPEELYTTLSPDYDKVEELVEDYEERLEDSGKLAINEPIIVMVKDDKKFIVRNLDRAVALARVGAEEIPVIRFDPNQASSVKEMAGEEVVD